MMMYEKASSSRLKSMNYLADVKMVPFSGDNQVSGTKTMPRFTEADNDKRKPDKASIIRPENNRADLSYTVASRELVHQVPPQRSLYPLTFRAIPNTP